MSKQQYVNAIEKYGGNFTANEFALREGASMTDLDYEFFLQILQFRQWAGFPMLVSSAYRPGDDGAHGNGFALDFIMFNTWKKEVLDPWRQWRMATTWPFTGVGIYFDWYYYIDGRRIPAVGLHTDCEISEDRPQRWLRIEAEHDEEFQKLYYYQDVKTGRFYNSDIQRNIELADVIESVWRA